MQLWKMLISFVFCVVMWSALQVQAQWIQPSPSFTTTEMVSSSSQITCQYYQFRCNNGYQCVHQYYLCDGRYQCSDGSDEWYSNCVSSSIQPSSTASLQVSSSSQITCGYYQFRCNNGYQCVYRNYLCDGRNQCSDGSDEWYSNCGSSIQPSSTTASLQVSSLSQIACQYYEFRCYNGYQCIHQYYVCNGYSQCSDGSDEWPHWGCRSFIQPSSTTASLQVSSSSQIACQYYEFRCYNGYQCIHQYYVCNGYSQCSDGSDEWPHWGCRSSSIQPSSTTASLQVSSSSQITCQYYQFRCYNGYQCIHQYYVCNGYSQCFDGSDEWPHWGCRSSIQPSSTTASLQVSSSSQIACRYYEFRCYNGYQCIHQYYVCNGYSQCSDGSDEWPHWGCRSSIQPSSTVNVQVSSSSSPTSRYCSFWEFNCRNGRCINKGDVCNNYDNCGDGSDERRSICSGNVTICEHKIDLGFILDNSGSVGRQNFERMKLFVKDLTDFYKLGPDETRVSVMSYSNSANIHIAFSAYYSDKNQFDWAVNSILYTGGGTATALALNMAYNTMFTSRYGARGSESKKVLVILTDGQSGQVSGPARQLKNSGVVIFSVGIGQSLSLHELQVMASDPVNQHVITLDNFSQLDRLAEQMSSKTCNASNFKVICDNDYMTAVFDRADLPKNVNINRLYLRSRYCKAEWNSTHVIVKTALTGCGTVFSKNDQTLFFSNVLSEEEGSSSGIGVVTRDYLFKANLTCTYPRKRTVGSFNFAPAKERLFVNVGGQGNFTLTLDVFKSINYGQSYTSQDYPVLKSLSDNLYIQYSINTSNSDLVVRAEACRATPTNKPYDTPQYVFIADGCDKDETIRHYTYGMSSVQRFSMQAFRFLSEHRFVYLHCDLVVCYRYDYNSTCARSTLCPRRYRRDVDRPAEDVSGTYPLSFGPIMKGEESADKNTGGVLLNQ